jgi:hypothetical protein
MAGLTAMFRYDVGLGLAGVNMLTMALAISLRERGWTSRLRHIAAALWPYLLGFALVVAPAAIAYLSVAPLHDFLYDIVLYPAKYYRVSRSLPFPAIHRKNLDDLIVYLFPVLIGLGLYRAVLWIREWRRSGRREPLPDWIGLLVAFGAVAALMYLKGLVRIGSGQLAMCTLPCILIAALLFEHRRHLRTPVRVLAIVALILFVAAGAISTLQQLLLQHHQRVSTLEWMVSPAKQQPLFPFQRWCGEKNPLTRGFCFVLDGDHIQAVEFLTEHTRPGDTLYVGLPQHERIFVNDNITYFATQRLPATKWSHFDPFLQNREDIQREMIGELQRHKPPYIVLDSEFEGVREPNGSSVSTGVHLLDDYIAAHYTSVRTFGELTILERRPPAS